MNIFHASWDHHSNLDAELKHNCLMADHPIASLLKDLKQRGLLDSTLVLGFPNSAAHRLGKIGVGGNFVKKLLA